MAKRFNFGLFIGLIAVLSMLLAACGESATNTAVVAPTNTTAAVAPTDTAMAVVPTDTAMAVAPTETPMAVEPTTATTGGTTLKIGLVTDVGSVNDKNFNQASWEGAQAGAAAVGTTATYIETKDPKDYQANIEQMVSDGANVIVTVGFALGEATIAEAKANPNIKFIGVDQFQGETVDNLAGLIFDEDKAGYLAGVLAASVSKSGKIGEVLATDTVPPVWRYGEGFKVGAKSVNPDIDIQAVYHSDVDLSKTFNDPAWGKTTANSMIDKGVDVVFGAGGSTGNGALIGATERNIMAIGVDVDQYNTVPEAQKALISSATKDLTGGVVDIIKAVSGGTFKGGNITGKVGLAPFHDFDAQISADIKAKLTQVTADLASGTIKTGVAPAKPADGEATPTVPNSVNTGSLKIGLVTDVGSVNDKNFNQASWEGAQQGAAAVGSTATYIETKDPKDYQANIEQMVSDGANVIVTVGFALGEATIAEAKAHPDIKFIGVDQFQGETVDNLAGLIFNEDQAGYLAGVLAASVSKSGKIGEVLATDTVPPVWRYGEGFKVGAKSVKADIEIQAVYHSDVDLSKTFNDPAWGKTTANSMLDKGVDVIFSAGGTTGNGGLTACAERGAMAIGVDVDQYNTVPEAQKALISSATKDLTGGVVDIIKAIAGGTFKGGNITGKVGLAPFHDFDAQISADVKAKLTQVIADLASGAIKTGVSAVKP